MNSSRTNSRMHNTRTCINTHAQTHIHTHTHTHTYTHTHTHTHTHIYTYTHTVQWGKTLVCVCVSLGQNRVQILWQTRNTHITTIQHTFGFRKILYLSAKNCKHKTLHHIHIHTRAHIATHTYIHIHTHTHTHTRIRRFVCLC